MAILLIFIGLLVVCFLALRSLLTKLTLSPIVGYLAIGWGVSSVVSYFPQLSPVIEPPLSALSKIGLVLLLFHIGLASHLKNLIRFVGKAGIIACIEVVTVGVSGWLVSRWQQAWLWLAPWLRQALALRQCLGSNVILQRVKKGPFCLTLPQSMTFSVSC